MKSNRSERISDILTLALCFVLLTSLGIALFFKPQKSFSERENRALSLFPTLSANAFTNGSFFADVASFYSDQFPCREVFTALRTHSEKLLLKCENGGIIFAKDGYLLQKDATDFNILNKNLSVINDFCKKYGAYFIIAPQSIYVLSDKLPTIYGAELEEKSHTTIQNSCSNTTAITDALKNAAANGEYVYFKTDHHWTAEGAYIAYTEIAPYLEISPYKKNAFTEETAAQNFLGTSFSKSGLYSADGDTVTLLRYNGDEALSLYNEETKTTEKGLYRYEKLKEKDKYLVFLGGNFSRISITNENGARERLLIIKDSFANSLIPFLAMHFDLDVIDPRYYKGNISEIISQNEYKNILMLFGAGTLGNTRIALF